MPVGLLRLVLGQLLLGVGITLTLLRVVVYFRDRDRAGSFGVFDVVGMICDQRCSHTAA